MHIIRASENKVNLDLLSQIIISGNQCDANNCEIKCQSIFREVAYKLIHSLEVKFLLTNIFGCIN